MEPPPPGLEDHPHARAVLAPAWPPTGAASHAYLFHGPAGSGKRAIARAFAAALLSDGAADPPAAHERVLRDAHPDLTWVVPSGANEMLVGDIEQAVVAAIARTPFESRRRVFVIEAAQTMSDQVANRLLKTLEEPPAWAHLILLAHHPRDVLPTIASRCQQVRFDPLSTARITERLSAGAAQGLQAPEGVTVVDALQAQACAGLALGDADMAAWLAGEQGQTLRTHAQAFVRDALHERTGERAWLGMLEQAKGAASGAGEQMLARSEGELELLPTKERARARREATEAQRRIERRERTRTLDAALRLAELWLRDAWCIAMQAPELVYAVDRMAELGEDAAAGTPARLRRAWSWWPPRVGA